LPLEEVPLLAIVSPLFSVLWLRTLPKPVPS
jgi:hypothetical protein